MSGILFPGCIVPLEMVKQVRRGRHLQLAIGIRKPMKMVLIYLTAGRLPG